MKKWAFAVGIILLLLTPILLTSYKMSTTGYASGLASTTEPSNLYVWECAGNFSANDLILVDLLPNIFWSSNESAFDVLDNGMPVMYADINITDPKNSTSTYELEFTYNPTDIKRNLHPYNLTVLSAGEGINQTVNVKETGVTFIAGIAKLDGTYFANLTFVGFMLDYRADGRFTPGTFALYWGRTEESHPYMSLLYVNFVTIPASVIFLVYGLKKTDRKRRRAKNETVKAVTH